MSMTTTPLKKAISASLACLLMAGLTINALAETGHETKSSDVSKNKSAVQQQKQDAVPATAPKASPSPAPATPPTPAIPKMSGAALYAVNCTLCHGMAKRGSSGSKILRAISNNTGGMGPLKTLTAAEIAAISQY